jgi:Holliday junction resolvasome RuvABC endonuclease subunit
MGKEHTVIGIDPAATHIAFTIFYPDETWDVVAIKKLGKSGAEACCQARLVTLATIDSARSKCKDSTVHCFYEMPILGRGGFRSTIVQCFTSGAVQGAIYERQCPSYPVNVSSWKKAVVGKGNADKGQVGEFLRLRWNAIYTAAEGNQDVYDATAIALYGRQILAQGLA